MEESYADQGRRELVIGGAILVGVAVALLALVGRLVFINTTLSEPLGKLVDGQQLGRMPVPARRGSILDARGRVLAGTRLGYSVFADPGLIDSAAVAEVARRLQPMLGLPAGQIEETIRQNSHRRFCWLARGIDPIEADAVRDLKIRGVELRREPQRSYPMGPRMAQTIGIVGRDGQGLEGLELLCDDHLGGCPGERQAIYDGRKKRRPIYTRDERTKAVHDGGHIILTLDAVIQEFVENRLAEAVTEFEAESGVGLVMSPDTGAILAMGQYPTFDPNHYNDFPAERRRNRVVTDAVEPGSTFKPYVGCAILMGGAVRPGEEIFCGNGLHYFGRRAMHDSTPHGNLDFQGIIARSSNIGMGILSERIGNAAIHEMVRAFGFGSPTGVDFPGEAPGRVRPLEEWTTYSTTSVPIGQEIAVTPLQLATAFSAIVNGGLLIQPYLVEARTSPEGRILESGRGPRIVRRVLPTEVADYMTRRVLVAVVEEGGGKRAALADWQVLGKTGTAQIASPDGPGYVPGAYIGSFIGAVPAEDPEIVVLVMVQRPNPALGYYGTTVAAPAVRGIMADTLSYLGVPPSPSKEIDTNRTGATLTSTHQRSPAQLRVR